jgi:hypothetical protein
MGALQFISSVIDSLAWPVAVLIAAWLLRQPLTNLAAGRVRRFHAGPSGLEIEFWDEQASKTRSELPRFTSSGDSYDETPPLASALKDLAQASPETAVEEAHSRVQATLQLVLIEAGSPAPKGLDTHALVNLAVDKGLIDDQTRRSVEGLIVLWQIARSSMGELTADRATEYLALADAVIYSIKSSRRRK